MMRGRHEEEVGRAGTERGGRPAAGRRKWWLIMRPGARGAWPDRWPHVTLAGPWPCLAVAGRRRKTARTEK